MSRQSSLSSFFGGAVIKKSHQTKLKSFLGDGTSSADASKRKSKDNDEQALSEVKGENKEREENTDAITSQDSENSKKRQRLDNEKKEKEEKKEEDSKENKPIASGGCSSKLSKQEEDSKKKHCKEDDDNDDGIIAKDDKKERKKVMVEKKNAVIEKVKKRRRRVIDDDDSDDDDNVKASIHGEEEEQEDTVMKETVVKNAVENDGEDYIDESGDEDDEDQNEEEFDGDDNDNDSFIDNDNDNDNDSDNEIVDDNDDEKEIEKSKRKKTASTMNTFFKKSGKNDEKKSNKSTKKKALLSKKKGGINDDRSKSKQAAKEEEKLPEWMESQLPPKSDLQKVLKGEIKSDRELIKQLNELDDISTTAGTGLLPYSIMCSSFEEIESISSRLQIQEIFTNLIRKIMLRSNLQAQIGTDIDDDDKKSATGKKKLKNKNTKEMDLYDILYLASNTVAPAYKCIELGIGDAILIKAISEAYGSNTKTVKEKYDKDGDLGFVAQSFKSKQRTLGGFFGSTKSSVGAKTKKSSKNPLTCQEVLSTFREIANKKGNQSQKFKLDRIKKLLVRVTVPSETKYIIRGLQGRLRIGLAQTTVLISLAHAMALTNIGTSKITSKDDAGASSEVAEEESKDKATMHEKGNDKSDNDEDGDQSDKGTEPNDYSSYPDEVQQYCDSKLPPEKRLEGAVNIVKKAYSEIPSYDALLDALVMKKTPLELLHKACTLQPGTPIVPMLAKPAKSIQEIMKRLNGQNFTCEYKYDGERAQVHLLADGSTKVFSRNLLDTSEKFPEVPLYVKEATEQNGTEEENCKVTSFVLDTEVVAYNNKTKQLVPFQVLSTRKKTEESAETAKVQVIVQAFDLMYFNGKSLLNETLAYRRQILFKYFKPVPNKFQFAISVDTKEDGDTTAIEEFLDKAVKSQCEGLMIKTLDTSASVYEPSKRSLNWLKLKKDYLSGAIGDSIDLVPIGAFYGRGKRTGVYGAYLLTCYDVDKEEYQSVCKIGTGFNDENLVSLAAELNEHKIPKKSSQYNVSDSLVCDVWFDAVKVWEIKAADLSMSSTHKGALGRTGEGGRGIGLRFPRFERRRDDKRPEEATSSDQILEMYYNQDSVLDNDGDDGGNGDDDCGI